MRRFFQFFSVRWLVIAFCVWTLTVMSGICVTYGVLTRVYRAHAEIEIMSHGADGKPEPTLLSNIEVMLSPSVEEPIVTDLGLDRIWAKRVYKSTLDVLPMQDALGYLNRIVRLSEVPGTNMIRITVSSEVPKEAADIANAYADRFLVVRSDENRRLQERSEEVLRKEIAEQQQVVSARKTALEQMTAPSPGTIAPEAATMHLGQKQLQEQQGVLDDLNVRLRRILADAQMQEAPVKIISRAEPPEFPFMPNHQLNITISAVEGIFVGAAVASLLEVFLRLISPGPPARQVDPQNHSPSLEY